MPLRALASALIAILSVLVSTSVAATAQRTFVASYGNDANACTLTSPCRAFAAAVAQVNSGGEVIVLDSAGYGPVTITKSVSIVAPAGVYAGVSVASGNGVTVAASATDKVVLHGLTLNGPGAGANYGILITSGNEIQVEDCTVSNFLIGVEVEGGDRIRIARVVARDNTFAQVHVYVATPIAVMVAMNDSYLAGGTGTAGFWAYASAGSIDATVARVVSTDIRFGAAFCATAGGPSATVSLAVVDSIGTDSLQGVCIQSNVAGATATGIVSGSTLVRNSLGDLQQQGAGAVLRTAGDNAVTGRGAADIVGTLTANGRK